MLLRIFKTAIFVGSIWWSCFHWCHGCREEERIHLLQIKDSINYPQRSFLDSYWIGKNCCQWKRIKCNPSSSRVVFLHLAFLRDQRLRLWYPNASLFTPFKELEHLSFYGNQIGGWVMPQGKSPLYKLHCPSVPIKYFEWVLILDDLSRLYYISFFLYLNMLGGFLFYFWVPQLSVLGRTRNPHTRGEWPFQSLVLLIHWIDHV